MKKREPLDMTTHLNFSMSANKFLNNQNQNFIRIETPLLGAGMVYDIFAALEDLPFPGKTLGFLRDPWSLISIGRVPS